MDQTWANYLPKFLIYAMVIAQFNPWRNGPLFQ